MTTDINTIKILENLHANHKARIEKAQTELTKLLNNRETNWNNFEMDAKALMDRHIKQRELEKEIATLDDTLYDLEYTIYRIKKLKTLN